ncbi:MAG: hypothetical protein NZM42_04255 [Gemmatales bacterium]|nr:hypothetical protein [Gemmatales bacterium]
MLETFTLRLVVGMLLALVLLPMGEVPSRFYRLHLLIALGLLTLTGMVARSREDSIFWLGLGGAGASCFVGTWFWLAEANPLGFVPLVLATLASALALSACVVPGHSMLWLVLDNATAAAQLGLVLTAMLLGHYYLITPGMSPRPLLRLTSWLLGAIAARGALLSADGATIAASFFLMPAHRTLWWILRWLAGIVAASVFVFLAWRCARLRSTQSATGILYAAVVASFLGELAQLLLENAN